ncbi:MAG: hypothetical protein M3069_25335 [Chloroflexota bacterium]|nr:hypothetical protein [Chloroflexota bacterium]
MAVQRPRDAAGPEGLAAEVESLYSRLARAPDPELRLDLARALQWLHRFDEAREQLETAFREFTDAGLAIRAALAASRLGEFYRSGPGNRIAGRAWFARAWRLIENAGPCLERGWVALTDVGCNFDDPEELRERATIALDIARRFGDIDLEAKALADLGLALTESGRVTEGMALVDEALALVSAHAVRERWVVSQAVCSFFSACWCASDLARLESWTDILRERALLAATDGQCDSVYGTLLCQLGRWQEAESVLNRSIQLTEMSLNAVRLKALCALAEFRIFQGRLGEAEQLLVGRDDHMAALIPMARLYLARGDHELAASAARRGLRLLGSDRLRGAQMLSVLVQAELGRGDVEAAGAAAARLRTCAMDAGISTLMAEAAFACARVLTARGEATEAIAELAGGLARLGDAEVPLLRSKLHLELARLLAVTTPGEAVLEARAVAAIHARVDAPLGADAAELLRELGVAIEASHFDVRARPTPTAQSSAATSATLERGDAGWWTIRSGQSSFMLKDSKGMRCLAELIAHPGVECHVLDLVELTDPPDPGRVNGRRHLGDAGPSIDAQARAIYRQRIEELRTEVEDALRLGNDTKANLLQQELDAIVGELARAIGLSSRARRAASGAERARINLTRTIRAAIARICRADHIAGNALDRDIRTGVFCSYQPSHTDLRWSMAGSRTTRR